MIQPSRHPSDAVLPTSREIIEALDEHIIGQTAAKQTLAAAVYNHYLLAAYAEETGRKLDTRHKNVFFTGPTGSGKTEIVRRLADILRVPFTVMSATALTQEGYVGMKPEDIIRMLLQAAGWNEDHAQHGIVFLDETDKIRRHPAGAGLDVSGEGAQWSLLPFLDGNTYTVTNGGNSYSVDTSRLFIVAAGAFSDLYRNHATSSKSSFTTEQLVEFGLLDEFVGRFSRIVSLDALSKDQLSEVLHRSGRVEAIKLFFNLHEVQLEITEAAARHIGRMAFHRGTGARGVPTLVSEILADFEIQLPELRGRRVTIDVTASKRKLRVAKDEPQDATGGQNGNCVLTPTRSPTKAEELRLTALRWKPTDQLDSDIELLRRDAANPFSDISGMSENEIEKQTSILKRQLAFSMAGDAATKWWHEITQGNPANELCIARELFFSFSPPVKLSEFYLAALMAPAKAKTILGLLYYLKFTRSNEGRNGENNSPSNGNGTLP